MPTEFVEKSRFAGCHLLRWSVSRRKWIFTESKRNVLFVFAGSLNLVTDIAFRCEGAPLKASDIFTALSFTPIPGSVPVVCPNLQELDMSGMPPCSDSDIEALDTMIRQRTLLGAVPLQRLELRLSAHENLAALERRRNAVKALFAEVIPNAFVRFTYYHD